MSQIENLTPHKLRCTLGVSCPSIHRLEDGRYRIVGKIDPTLTVRDDGSPIDPEAWDGIGQDETAVIIPGALLDTIVAEKVKEERERIAKLVDEFHWQLPMFSDAKDNELTDDAAEAVRDQIVAMLRALTPSTPGEEG